MKVAIVNDMGLAVEALRRVVQSVPENELLWVARDGAEAVEQCRRNRPELILMDLIMPVMDGVEATRRIMAESPCAILVVTATVEGNSDRVYEAMGHGALDAVNTPQLGMMGQVSGGAQLLAKMATIRRLLTPATGRRGVTAPMTAPVSRSSGAPLIVIGSSTGGPQALAEIFGKLEQNFPVPILVVQHVDVDFSAGLANWLDAEASLRVKVACVGDEPKVGEILIAGTNDHLVMRADGRLAYMVEPKEAFYRPSVDVLFESVAKHWKGRVLAVLLTGMGRDGAKGMLALQEKGSETIAQSKETCVVYGMPKAAVELGAARKSLAPSDIASELVEFARRS
jgi:two-component system response regulator WspF